MTKVRFVRLAASLILLVGLGLAAYEGNRMLVRSSTLMLGQPRPLPTRSASSASEAPDEARVRFNCMGTLPAWPDRTPESTPAYHIARDQLTIVFDTPLAGTLITQASVQAADGSTIAAGAFAL